MVPTLSQVSSLNWPFEQDVADYAAGQCRSIEVWLTKLETHLERHSVDDVRRLLDECQVEVPVAGLQGGLLTSQGEARRAAWELFERRLELCRQLGIGTLVVACDIPRPLAQADIERAQRSLIELAGRAGRWERRVALEFQAGSALGNNLQTAAALVAEVGSPHLGLCLDTYHFHVGPSGTDDLRYVTGANLFHVQLSDIADTPRELATDADRILPGDGDIDFEPLLARLRAIDYQGPVALELLNPRIWQIPPLEFGEIGMTALRKLLGLASHG